MKAGVKMRKNYLDNIRWITVILVLIYHVPYLFNNVGVLGGVGSEKCFSPMNAIMYFVYPWFMVLLFLIAGISTRYALQKRTVKEFLNERARKLLVPSTLGLFVLHWITGYLNLKIGGVLESMPSFIVYPVSVLSGVGPLWFIQLLFVFSLLIILIYKVDQKDRLWELGGKANTVVIVLFFVVLWGASQILNMPMLTMYRFGIYFTAYLIGYAVFSHEEVMERVEKFRIPMLIVATVAGIAYTITYWGQNFTSSECLQSVFTNFYAWIAILAMLGCGKCWLNGTSKFTSYMTKASFGLYILHYPILLVCSYLLYQYCPLPNSIIYLIALVGELIITPICYEVIRRIPVIRYLVLGISGKKKAS